MDAQGEPLTMGSYLVAGSSHFTIYRNARAANLFDRVTALPSAKRN